MRTILFSMLWMLPGLTRLLAQSDPIAVSGLYSLGNDFQDRAYAVTVDDSGNTVMSGSASSAMVNFDLLGGSTPGEHPVPGNYLVRYRADQSVQWARYSGYSESRFVITHLETDRMNHTLVLGYYRGLVDIDFGQSGTKYLQEANYQPSFFLAQLDSNGKPIRHVEWVALSDSFDTYTGDRTFVTDLSLDENGNIYLAGYSGSVFTTQQLPNDTLREFTWFVIKLDSSLQVQWMDGLEKVVHEFHNWTNFLPVMADADRNGNVYVTLCFGDSINLHFSHEPPNYLSAKPYDYTNPPSQESSNRDLLIIQYDVNGNYLRHRRFHSDRVSSEKNLDADVLPNDHLYVLAAYDREFSVDDSTWNPPGIDSLYDYNLILLELDDQLNLVRHRRFHNNILSPRGHYNYLEADECGNLLVRIDRVMYNGFPFPPFDDNSLPILYKENTYVFNEALDVIDTISFPDFNLYDFLSADIHNGHLAMTGTFADDFHVEHFTVFERNPVPSNSYYDNFLLLGDYTPCRLPIPEPLPEVIIPNVFTPDGDGLNDTWQVRDTTGRFAARWQIFNRWGQEVSHGSFPGSGWTGTDERRQPCPDGVYFYILAIENSSIHQEERGWVKLIR